MSTPQTRRKTRTDAECNRDRVLHTSRALFAQSGYDMQMSQVAQAAGVGIGTLYRKFPTRETLIEAIAKHRAAEIVANARQLTGADDPAQGLAGLLHYVGEALAGDRGISEAIEKVMGSAEPRGEPRKALLPLVAKLIDQARVSDRAGQNVTTADINIAICGLVAVIRNAAGVWQRYFEVALNGLRPR
ncbi:helix-turn-helix domain-containing protein [Nonomuraea sp. NPDC048882]|uniref:TetR/AcrR family transcriptional regulator n=1 Tax=Nonomuraea sp. NPDC048882 TaxID=3154347 RepID=UPI0033DD779C